MNDQTEIRAEQNLARQAAELIPVSGQGVEVQNFAQQVDYAKWMAKAGFAIAKHLRDNVGACLAVLDISQRWGFSPFQVARLCYVVNDQLGFESQLVHAVIEKFAPLQKRLRCEFKGDGDSRQCIVTGMIKGEIDPLVYESPLFNKISPKNSPLWKTDPDQQLWYYSSRSWARRFCPDVILGIYGRDELQDNPHIGAENAKDVTDAAQKLHDRLAAAASGANGEGFRPSVVDDGLGGKPKRKRRSKAEMEAAHGSTETKVKMTAAIYVEQAEAWVAQLPFQEALARWNAEDEIREQLQVSVADRIRLRGSIEARNAAPQESSAS